MNIPFIYLIVAKREQNLSNVYIYESGAYPNDARINRETTTTNNNNNSEEPEKNTTMKGFHT